MAESAGQQSNASLSWWVRVCRAGWKAVRYIWVTFLLALVLPKVVEALFSDKPLRSLPNLWPALEAVITHPIWTLLTFLGLLLFTGLFWFGSRESTPTTQDALSEHDRIYMLRRLRLRYEQMLAQSLQGAVQVELGLASRAAAVRNAVSLSFRLPDQPDQQLPPHTSIREAYELAQQELLILGEPGAGKSTLLLELAHSLIEQAEQDTIQPLPVLLPLSSWATNSRPLHEWLSEQFALLYDVPRSLSQQWLQTKQLLPLLDGLDEMDASARAACVAAINTYHRERLQPLVVCSRTNEYVAAATRERLALHAAVVVQPLSRKQVDTHLTSIGKPLAALRAVLRNNTVLRELATTPLMLQVLMLTYHGTLVQELSHKEAQLREQIWDEYVQRMVCRKGNTTRYSLEQTCHWLAQLAVHLRSFNQDVFTTENLQPRWLSRKGLSSYLWSIRLFVGVPFGALFGLFNGIAFGKPAGLFFGLIFGLLSGLLAVREDETIPPAKRPAPLSSPLTQQRKSLQLIYFGLTIGISCGMLIEERVGMSFGVFIGTFSGVLVGVLVWILVLKLVSGPITLLSKVLDHRYTLKSGLLAGMLTGLFFGLLFGLFTGLFVGLLFGLFAGLFAGLFFGLEAFLKRYILRFWLWQTGAFPFRINEFLEDARARHLLKRFGESYQFMHRLLLDYFADRDAHLSLPSTSEPSTPPPTL